MTESNGRILIVDDSELVVTMLSDHLETEGYEIVVASNGAEGFSKVREVKPDLVITDVQMPEMNGHDFTRKIRAQSDLSALPVVMITTLNTMEDRIQGIESGADDFINKPFNKQILLLKMRNLLRSAHLHRKVAENYEALQIANQALKRLQDERQYTMDVVGEELRNMGENLRMILERLEKELGASQLGLDSAKLLLTAVQSGRAMSDKINKTFKSG